LEPIALFRACSSALNVSVGIVNAILFTFCSDS
jgi:hypothetical protein